MRIRIVLALASALVVVSVGAAYAGQSAPMPLPPDAVTSPELDAKSAGTALALLITALLVIRGR
jgi:hypothetical protein